MCKVSNLAFAMCFHETIFSLDMNFSKMTTKRTFGLYNQLSF